MCYILLRMRAQNCGPTDWTFKDLKPPFSTRPRKDGCVVEHGQEAGREPAYCNILSQCVEGGSVEVHVRPQNLSVTQLSADTPRQLNDISTPYLAVLQLRLTSQGTHEQTKVMPDLYGYRPRSPLETPVERKWKTGCKKIRVWSGPEVLWCRASLYHLKNNATDLAAGKPSASRVNAKRPTHLVRHQPLRTQ